MAGAPSNRTVRVLEARLEALALVWERSLVDDGRFDPRVLGAVAATRHAVQLELLSAEEADRIWSEVSERHPSVAWCRFGLRHAA